MAHREEVAHRDVKPDNILLDYRRPELVYLTDFGLSRDLDIATLEQLRDGSGTPLYMAPEKLRGVQTDEVRCDVYAMGVTLYEALTLAPLFGCRRIGGNPADCLPFGSEPLAPPATFGSPAGQAEAILRRAIKFKPTFRTATATERASQLEAYINTANRRIPIISRRSRAVWGPSHAWFVSRAIAPEQGSAGPRGQLFGTRKLRWWAVEAGSLRHLRL